MTKEEMKERVCEVIEAKSRWITEIGEVILKHPEMGFKEYQTSNFLKSKFREIGLEPRDGIAITGMAATLKGRREGVRVAVMGEMDGLIVPNHPLLIQSLALPMRVAIMPKSRNVRAELDSFSRGHGKALWRSDFHGSSR
jgi:hypothetical protein